MMKRARRDFTRRSFTLSLLIAPLACLGCGGDHIVIAEKAGEKRRQMMEDRQKRADLKRKPQGQKAP